MTALTSAAPIRVYRVIVLGTNRGMWDIELAQHEETTNL